jgi:arginase
VLDVALGVADKVSAAVRHQFFPLVLGGDCTVTIGVLEGLRRHHNNLGLMYLDGDVDLNTPQTTNTGIFDGMVLAHILGKGVAELSQIGNHSPLVPEENIVLFGYNPAAGWMDPAEIEFLHQTSMMKYPVLGIRGRVQPMALEAALRLEKKVEQYLVHFDVDVIDFHDLPVGDVPHDRGLSMREAIEALQIFVSSPKCAGLVITEFNVLHDADGGHAKRLMGEVVRVLA